MSGRLIFTQAGLISWSMGWRLLQLFIFLAFVFANIYFQWKIPGMAAGVAGGMLAYYVTVVVAVLLSRRQRIASERGQ
jgi:uncharacterized PurR-regulated membrane protein YhhQ (DUF165 family)